MSIEHQCPNCIKLLAERDDLFNRAKTSALECAFLKEQLYELRNLYLAAEMRINRLTKEA